ncbi:MAG: hypothetical protein ACI4FX_05215 [Agathobacter sp.]
MRTDIPPCTWEQAGACKKNRIRDASEEIPVHGICKEAAYTLLLSVMDRILTGAGKSDGQSEGG